MKDKLDPLAVEHHFFTSLIEANVDALEGILSDDFMLIDVMRGSEIPKSALLEIIRSGHLKFEAIDPADSRVRLYGTTAVITGRTRMNMRFQETAFTVYSRYTHVYVEQEGQWRLVAAQGTQIPLESE